MAKRRIYKKPKNGEKIPVTARQLQELLFDRNGRLNSREYADLRRMELVESSARDAIHKLSLWAEPEDIVHYGNDFNKMIL